MVHFCVVPKDAPPFFPSTATERQNFAEGMDPQNWEKEPSFEQQFKGL